MATYFSQVYQKKWNPTEVKLHLFENSKPLIDNTHTPRSREKAISLERNYCGKRWVPPRTALDEFIIKKKKLVVH